MKFEKFNLLVLMEESLKVRKYVEEKKELYNLLLEFLEESDSINLNFNNLTNFINSKHFLENHEEILHILRLIVNIANNHHHTEEFFKKIEQFIDYQKDKIKQILSNTEIFDSIKSNKKILLYFLQHAILTLDKDICNEIILNPMTTVHDTATFSSKKSERVLVLLLKKK